MTDPIADLLTRIRNGATAGLRYVEIPVSKLKLQIVKTLKDQGYIEQFLVREGVKGTIRVYLKYDAMRRPLIRGIKRVSSPSCRRYAGYKELPWVYSGLGITIVSTSRGVLVDSEARKQKLGGEMLCQVW